MFPLTPEFMRFADPMAAAQSAGNDSATEADEGGALTLEMRDNPSASFMRKFERLIDLDPQEAFRMAQIALLDKIFDGRAEEKIRLRMNDLIDFLHQNGQTPDLSGAFTKSVLNTGMRLPLVPSPAYTFAPVPGR